MGHLITVPVLTDGSGDYSVTVAAPHGRLLQYRYVPDGSSPLATGADLTITSKQTGTSLVSQTNIGTTAFSKAPRQPIHDEAGTASLYAAGGEPVSDFIYIAGEALTVTIAQGGAGNAGTLHIWVG